MHIDIRLSHPRFYHIVLITRLYEEYVRATLLAHPGLLLHAHLAKEDYLHFPILLLG